MRLQGSHTLVDCRLCYLYLGEFVVVTCASRENVRPAFTYVHVAFIVRIVVVLSLILDWPEVHQC